MRLFGVWHINYFDELLFAYDNIDDPLLHLAVHIALVGSCRPGENVGILIENVFLQENLIKIETMIDRISEEAIENTSNKEILYYFPKKVLKVRAGLY